MKTKLILLLIIFNSIIIAQTPNWAWAKTAGSAANWDMAGGNDYYTSTITTDKYGNSYVTGHFTGTAVFGTITVSSPTCPAVFTAKYDSSGNCIWVKHFGAAVPPPPAPMQMANNGKAIDIDSLGNCYVTGVFQGSLTDTIYFGTSKLVGYDNVRPEIFLVKYDANGNEIWARQSKYLFGFFGGEISNSISVDKAGNSFVSFHITSDNMASFGNLPPLPGHGSYVVKHDASGNPQWTRQLGVSQGPPNGVFIYAIESDENGNCYVTGVLSGTAVAGTSPQTTLTAFGNLNQKWDTYVAKLNSNGTIAWLKQFGHPQGLSFGTAIGVDASGNVIFGGNFAQNITIGTITLSSGTPTNSSAYTIFFSKLGPSGNITWANNPFTASPNSLSALKVSPSGNFYFSAGDPNVSNLLLVGKLNTAGSTLWLKGVNTSQGVVVPAGISLDAQEDVYIAGNIQGTSSFGGHSISSAGGYDVMVAKITTLFTSPVGINEENENLVVSVFPNPFETELYITLSGSRANNVSHVVLYNLLGQEIRVIDKQKESGFVIKREDLAEGIYLYKIFEEKRLVGSGKFVAR